jgi:aryl-alcohol dehydrogenase-like predicted oxidoreductase
MMGECSRKPPSLPSTNFTRQEEIFLDCANMYMTGESKQWLGEWMALRGNRDQMVITTKYKYSVKMAFMEPEGSILSNHSGNNKKNLRISIETSLKDCRPIT